MDQNFWKTMFIIPVLFFAVAALFLIAPLLCLFVCLEKKWCRNAKQQLAFPTQQRQALDDRNDAMQDSWRAIADAATMPLPEKAPKI